MEKMNVKAVDLDIKFIFDHVKSNLKFTVESEKSQEIMYNILGIIDEYQLLKYAKCDIKLGNKYNAYKEYITPEEFIYEQLVTTIESDFVYEKENKETVLQKIFPKLTK